MLLHSLLWTVGLLVGNICIVWIGKKREKKMRQRSSVCVIIYESGDVVLDGEYVGIPKSIPELYAGTYSQETGIWETVKLPPVYITIGRHIDNMIYMYIVYDQLKVNTNIYVAILQNVDDLGDVQAVTPIIVPENGILLKGKTYFFA